MFKINHFYNFKQFGFKGSLQYLFKFLIPDLFG